MLSTWYGHYPICGVIVMFFRILGAVLIVIGGLLFLSETSDTTPALYQLLISAAGAFIGFMGYWLYKCFGGTLFHPEEDYRYRQRW